MTLLTTPEGGKLYLVGTAHFSVKSQNDVAMVNTFYFIFIRCIKYSLNYLNIVPILFLKLIT